jgi:hypothetical protein
LFECVELKVPQVTGYQAAVPVLDIGQCSEAVVLQFKDEVGVVEGVLDQTERIGLIVGSTILFYQN